MFENIGTSIFFQVPGRMGLLVTLHLISSNVYNSLNAPQKRGFSYIEVWMIGAQGVLDGSVNQIRFWELNREMG